MDHKFTVPLNHFSVSEVAVIRDLDFEVVHSFVPKVYGDRYTFIRFFQSVPRR